MKNNNFKKILAVNGKLLIVLMIVLTACKKDFLDVDPQGSETSALFPKSAEDARLAVNASYTALREWNYHSGGFPILDIMSDEATKGSNPGDAARLNLFDSFQFTASSTDIFPWYSALYKAVKRANIVIEKIPPIAMDENLKTRYIAEARFLRAFSYFTLVRAFGDVPMVVTTTPDYTLVRSPKQVIYDEVIIKDLEFAMTNLPEKDQYSENDIGRATAGAAKSLLAKVYLYLKDYQKAANYSVQVIKSNQYNLETEFTDAFSLAGQFGKESVFEIGAAPFEDFSQGGNQFANTQGVRGDPNKGWGFNRPSIALINSFEPNDKRKLGTVIFLGETIDGVLINGDPATADTTWTDATHTTIAELETYNRKVWTPGTTTVEEWGYNIREIRYSDVLLIAAEALNEIGKSDSALIFLNRVRDRAGVAEETSVSQSVLRDKIFNERHLEFAMEGQRFFDLVRTGRAAQVLGPYGFATGKNELFPIPESEIELSGGTLTQNPNWH